MSSYSGIIIKYPIHNLMIEKERYPLSSGKESVIAKILKEQARKVIKENKEVFDKLAKY